MVDGLDSLVGRHAYFVRRNPNHWAVVPVLLDDPRRPAPSEGLDEQRQLRHLARPRSEIVINGPARREIASESISPRPATRRAAWNGCSRTCCFRSEYSNLFFILVGSVRVVLDSESDAGLEWATRYHQIEAASDGSFTLAAAVNEARWSEPTTLLSCLTRFVSLSNKHRNPDFASRRGSSYMGATVSAPAISDGQPPNRTRIDTPLRPARTRKTLTPKRCVGLPPGPRRFLL